MLGMVSRIAASIGSSIGTGFPDMSGQVSNSSYLSTLLQQFLGAGGKFDVGDVGGGSYFLNNVITIDEGVIPGANATTAQLNTFATLLGHELGHAVVPGGSLDILSASSADQAAKIGLSNEGAAVTAEYTVAKQLGGQMWSGADIQATLDNIAKSQPSDGMFNPGFEAQAQQAASEFYATRTPSNAGGMNYSEYYSANWEALKSGMSVQDFGKIDWSKTTVSDFYTNADGSKTPSKISFSLTDGRNITIDSTLVDPTRDIPSGTETAAPTLGDTDNRLTAEQQTALSDTVGAISDGTMSMDAALKVMQGLGIAGDVLIGASAADMAYQAYQAYQNGDSTKANTIIGSWVASTEAAIAAGSLTFEATLAVLSPLCVGGPIGAAVAVGGAVVASIVAGTVAAIAANQGVNSIVNSTFNKNKPDSGRDPLVIDLGQGIAGSDPSTSGVSFDLTGNGVPVQTGWITKGGFLVNDPTNAAVTSGMQLFGDATKLPDGTTAANGFVALAALDSNGDGHINAQDAAFNNLRVWNGVSGAGSQLETLSQLGIVDISLTATPTHANIGGKNVEAETATVTWADGHTSTIAEIYLNDNTFYSQLGQQVTVTSTANALPQMQGSGQVLDMHQAASEQSAAGQAFQQLLAQYSQLTDRAQQLAMLPQLLDAWSNTSSQKGLMESNTFAPGSTNYMYEFKTIDPNVQVNEVQQYKDGVLPNIGTGLPTDGFNQAADQTAQYNQLVDETTVLEKFNGSSYYSSSAAQNAWGHNDVLNWVVGINGYTPNGASGPITTWDQLVSWQELWGSDKQVDQATAVAELQAKGYAPDDFQHGVLNTVQLDLAQTEDIQTGYAALESSVYDSLLAQTRLK
ncbi:MAG: hypothetical protein JO002_02090, partial [Burkholderiaceae bacterium]|nr:hypothetical protein [Burkholderiaceae bacterium]